MIRFQCSSEVFQDFFQCAVRGLVDNSRRIGGNEPETFTSKKDQVKLFSPAVSSIHVSDRRQTSENEENKNGTYIRTA